MANDIDAAPVLGLQHTGKDAFYMIHNPSDGGFKDFTKECLCQRAGAHIAVDRTTKDLLKRFNLTTASVFVHSQGAMVFNHALEELNREGRTKMTGMKTYYDGSAANYFASRNLTRAAGATIERFDGHPLDAVHNIVGMNTINPLRIVGSLLATPLLFQDSSWSPHGFHGGGSHLERFNHIPVLR